MVYSQSFVVFHLILLFINFNVIYLIGRTCHFCLVSAEWLQLCFFLFSIDLKTPE